MVMKMIYTTIFLLIIFCTQKTINFTDNNESPIVNTYGSTESFDIATWNWKEFPLDSAQTLKYLAKMIRNMDIDLFGIQEIKEESFFFQLLDSLKDYYGDLSSSDNYLKLGIIYKKDFISITNKKEIYLTDYDTMPRPPLSCYVEVKSNGLTVFDFSLVIIHLKAYGGEDNILKRKSACKKLKYFIDTQLLTSNDQDVIILGDWNDELNDVEDDNIFHIFLEDSLHYDILTKSLVNQFSYITSDSMYHSLLDHIVITADVKKEYGPGEIDVLYLDREFLNYTDYISDHRPVLARFMGVFQ
jgi:endonuclease/exonuclease/phosphatase family metal-dependent hydrolase